MFQLFLFKLKYKGDLKMGVTYKDMGFNLSEDEQRIYDAGYAQGKQTGMLIRGENTS